MKEKQNEFGSFDAESPTCCTDFLTKVEKCCPKRKFWSLITILRQIAIHGKLPLKNYLKS